MIFICSLSGDSVAKYLPAETGATGDAGLIPGSKISPGEGNGNPLQYSCLRNHMDREVCQAIVHGIKGVRHDWACIPDKFSYIYLQYVHKHIDYKQNSFGRIIQTSLSYPNAMKLDLNNWKTTQPNMFI